MNQYLEVYRRAAERKAEKWAAFRARENWCANPLKFVDATDLFNDDGRLRKRQSILALAWKAFQDNRFGTTDIVERDAFMHLFQDALTAFSSLGTKSQVQALILASEAIQNGETPTMYIARERGINRHSAYKLLKRAEKSLLETSSSNTGILKVEMRIKERARTMPRDCVYCGKECQDGLHALCKVCHARFVYRGEFLDRNHEREIQDSMRISTLKHWRKASQSLQYT